ncbi:MAG: nucleotide exchange factor GrpE [Wenzhouxiangella sp.]|nr:nucleotide exchange factor GrpE [Wenzhouxiangella sp.]
MLAIAASGPHVRDEWTPTIGMEMAHTYDESGHPEPAPDAAQEPVLDEGLTDESAPQSTDAETAPAADEEVARLRDALLRTRAEMDNLRKRNERELERSRRFINESLMKDLIPVLDALDQGLENAAEDDVTLREGLTMIRSQLLQNLSRHGLALIEPEGEPFDPEWHEAMSMQASTQHAPDSVMLVLQRGYTLHGRLVRPARVIVARAP